MYILGNIIVFITGIIGFIVSIMFIVACFRISVLRAILLFVPLVNIVVMISFLISNWDELKDLFFISLGLGVVQGVGTVMVLTSMPPVDLDPQDQKPRYADTAKETQPPPRSNDSNSWSTPRPKPRDTTPPPPPDDPIFEPGTLAEGVSDASIPSGVWPTFTLPDLDVSNDKKLNLHGYELAVPDIFRIQNVLPIDQGNGTQWQIFGGMLDNGRPVEMTVRVKSLEQQADGRVFTPSWSEMLGRASVSRSNYAVEYGRIGGIPFARCTDKLVRTGQGVGRVLYLGQLAPENPQQLEIEFATVPEGLGPSYAMMCEAVVRSLTRSELEMMPAPASSASLSNLLTKRSATESAPADWQIRGPFAFALGAQSPITFSRWSRDATAWTTSARVGGASDIGIQIRMHLDANIPDDRIRPIALQGPMRTDDVVNAFGGEAQYVKLWNDAVFARIEHKPQPRRDAVYNTVSYHGYLNQYRVDIEVTNRNDSDITMARLQEALLSSRLATVPQLAAATEQTDWLKELLAEDQPPFLVAGGVDATQALLLDERGGVAVSPQFDPKTQRMFEVFPPIQDIETLAKYEQWTSADENNEHLGDAETLDGDLEIRPIKELRESHRPKQLSWQARTKEGSVGMTVHIETLSQTDADLETPIIDRDNKIRFRLGRRIIQPSRTPEITYRELRNLRVWRINVPPSDRQSIARCHYLALVPGQMIVISTSYLSDRPEQLDAFDASVATLVYRNGDALKQDAGEE
jgi:hypothetical protein